MPELSPTSFPEEARAVKRLDRAAGLLRVQALQLDMISNYEGQLQSSIFSLASKDVDTKLGRKYRRALMTSDAYKILAIIWKESGFLTDKTLSDAGLSRNYKDGELTAHRLATDLVDDAHDVAKMNSRIRNIGLSAAAYKLVDRGLVHNTKVILKGTNVLHEFMLELNSSNALLVGRFSHVAPVVVPASNRASGLVGERK